MRFKMASRNPFRDFVRNLRRISISDYTDEEKHNLFYELWNNLSPKLSETELYLNSSPAYSSRCEHWNYRELNIQSIVPVSNLKNPYLRLKREFETTIIINLINVSSQLCLNLLCGFMSSRIGTIGSRSDTEVNVVVSR